MTNICCDKSFVTTSLVFVTTSTCLLQQNTSFVVTKVCMLRETFVTTNICHDKSFVATNIILLWQQTHICYDKYMSWQKFCHDKDNFVTAKTFVAASILLLRQKTCFVATNACLSWQKWYFWQLLPIIPPNTHFLTSWDQNLYSHLTDVHTLLAGRRLGITCQWRESTAAAATLGMNLRLDLSLFR